MDSRVYHHGNGSNVQVFFSLSQDVDLGYIARVTKGFSGADLTEICQRVSCYMCCYSYGQACQLLVCFTMAHCLVFLERYSCLHLVCKRCA